MLGAGARKGAIGPAILYPLAVGVILVRRASGMLKVLPKSVSLGGRGGLNGARERASKGGREADGGATEGHLDNTPTAACESGINAAVARAVAPARAIEAAGGGGDHPMRFAIHERGRHSVPRVRQETVGP